MKNSLKTHIFNLSPYIQYYQGIDEYTDNTMDLTAETYRFTFKNVEEIMSVKLIKQIITTEKALPYLILNNLLEAYRYILYLTSQEENL